MEYEFVFLKEGKKIAEETGNQEIGKILKKIDGIIVKQE